MMNDKKHIDRLFQEHFKDFEVAPNDAVWKQIETELNNKKKKRRVIPIWWRYAGVAALLLLLLTLGISYFNTSSNDAPPTNQVVDAEVETLKKLNPANKNSIEGTKEPFETTLASENNGPNASLQNSSQVQNGNSKNPINSSNQSSIANSFSSNKNDGIVKNALVNSNKSTGVATISEDDVLNKKPSTSLKNNAIVSNNSKENNTTILVDKEKAKELISNKTNNPAVAVNDKSKVEPLTNTEKEKNTSTLDDVVEQNKELIEEEKEKQNRWSITPNAAPVYFNSLGEGSSIDPQFNKNSKSGELNMSYGILASYAINNKITVRSGINKVNLGYNTNDVIVFQSTGIAASSSTLQNVNSSRNTNSDTNVSVISAESLNPVSAESFTTSNTSINQALGYIEVPLEIQYKLSDKKLGINVIGGFSSFFLNDNEIYSESQNGSRTFLGEANNINKISYSANFGLGFNYQVSKKIDLNLEPMFKYQINTFKNTSGNFTPFFIGVYTGFAIKF